MSKVSLPSSVKTRIGIVVVAALAFWGVTRVQSQTGNGPEALRNSFQTVTVAAGSFDMGCMTRDPSCYEAERPQHKVVIRHRIEAMTTEVSQKLYEKITGLNTSEYQECEKCPVERVSWHDATGFANALNERLGLESCYSLKDKTIYWSDPNCEGWRLPTEAEWEYLAKGGDSFIFSGGDEPEQFVWYGANSTSRTHPGGKKKPNGYGIYDMSGNVWEWVWDIYEPYHGEQVTNPRGANGGNTRIIRGGSWLSDKRDVRITGRDSLEPENSASILGFRLVRTKRQP